MLISHGLLAGRRGVLDTAGLYAFSNPYIRSKVTCAVLSKISLLVTPNTCRIIIIFYSFVFWIGMHNAACGLIFIPSSLPLGPSPLSSTLALLAFICGVHGWQFNLITLFGFFDSEPTAAQMKELFGIDLVSRFSCPPSYICFYASICSFCFLEPICSFSCRDLSSTWYWHCCIFTCVVQCIEMVGWLLLITLVLCIY